MWRRVQDLDRRLMKRSFGMRSPTLDRTLIAITRAANYSRLWLVVAGVLAVFGGRQGRRAARRGLVAIAIASAAYSIFAGYRAAYGWPIIEQARPDLATIRWFNHQQQRLAQAIHLLHWSVYSALAALVALAAAVGVLWLWPTTSPSLVSVTYFTQGTSGSQLTVCGQMTGLDSTDLHVTILSGPTKGPVKVPVASIDATAPETSC